MDGDILWDSKIGFTLDSGEIAEHHETLRCYILTFYNSLKISIVDKILNMQIVYLYLKAH